MVGRMKNIRAVYWAAFVIVVMAFFAISYSGFFWSDDFAMGLGEVHSFRDVLLKARDHYFNWGGGVFFAANQYLYCGLLWNNRIWFVLANTIMFAILLLACGNMVDRDKKPVEKTLLFALLFWFLCPIPRETLFWVSGSTVYLWTGVLVFLFLMCFFQNKDKNSSWAVKLLLLVFSMAMASSIIPCVSICGAFVVYYLFHIKELKGNVVPMVMGFVVGSLILVLAPGNFVRADVVGVTFADKIIALVTHPFYEVFKYKVLWLFVLAWLIGRYIDKEAVKVWTRNNAILLLALGWSVVAFSVVFRPSRRALFFPETLSLVLLLRFLTDPAMALAMEDFFNRKIKLKGKMRMMLKAFLPLLFVAFVVDACFACTETRKQSRNNDRLLNEISESNGVTGIDLVLSNHRMAFAPYYPDWSWPGVAYDLGLDSVHVYPYYCQEKNYKNSRFGENVYVDKEGLVSADWEEGSLGNNGIIFIRIKDNEKQSAERRLVLNIEYLRPRKWYNVMRNKGVEEKAVEVVREQPDESYLGYDYYIVWMKKENLENLKNVTVKMD